MNEMRKLIRLFIICFYLDDKRIANFNFTEKCIYTSKGLPWNKLNFKVFLKTDKPFKLIWNRNKEEWNYVKK